VTRARLDSLISQLVGAEIRRALADQEAERLRALIFEETNLPFHEEPKEVAK